MADLGTCQICGAKRLGSETICRRCELSLFQVTDILQTYIREKQPPDWLVSAVGELAWIFSEYPRTKAYLNTAMEITWTFILDGLIEINVDDVSEVNFTMLSRDRIINLLEEAMIIKKHKEKLLPGPLVEKLRNVRWEGYQLNTPEIKEKLLEIQGILSIALTRALVREKSFLPRRALAIFHMLSENMIQSGEQIKPVIPEFVFRAASAGLTARQKRHIQYIMSGFLDGHTKIISDVVDGELSLKDVMVEYCKNMRERWRRRERERKRG